MEQLEGAQLYCLFDGGSESVLLLKQARPQPCSSDSERKLPCLIGTPRCSIPFACSAGPPHQWSQLAISPTPRQSNTKLRVKKHGQSLSSAVLFEQCRFHPRTFPTDFAIYYITHSAQILTSFFKTSHNFCGCRHL